MGMNRVMKIWQLWQLWLLLGLLQGPCPLLSTPNLALLQDEAERMEVQANSERDAGLRLSSHERDAALFSAPPSSICGLQPRQGAPEKKAFVSLLFLDDAEQHYLQMLLTLIASVKRHSGATPFVVLITDSLNEDARKRIADAGALPKVVSTIPNPYDVQQRRAGFRDQNPERFKDVMTKLQIWNLTEYDQVLYMDSDLLTFGPMTGAFDCPTNPSFSQFVLRNMCDGVTNQINSGIIWLRPSTAVLDEMIAAIPNTASFDNTDQGFLQTFWGQKAGGFGLLHHSLCESKRAAADCPQQFAGKSFNCIHYVGEKPWEPIVTGTKEMYGPINDAWYKACHEYGVCGNDEAAAVAAKKLAAKAAALEKLAEAQKEEAEAAALS